MAEIKFTEVKNEAGMTTGAVCPFFNPESAFTFAAALEAQGVHATVKDQKVGDLTLPAVFVEGSALAKVQEIGFQIGPAVGQGHFASMTTAPSTSQGLTP